jgi:ubiquinone/menaquinone biosynthesis C-methylase UbiE
MGIKSLVAKHAGRPSGITGRLIAKLMWTKTKESNQWTVSLLNISKSDTILEIGFGLGYTLLELSKRAPDGLVCGIDISETMRMHARRVNSAEINGNRVDIRLGRVEDIPYGKEVFNKLLAVNVIYLWPDLELAIKEIHRVLIPGGEVALFLAAKQTMKLADLEDGGTAYCVLAKKS